MKKRLLSLFIALSMIIGIVPVSVIAAAVTDAEYVYISTDVYGLRVQLGEGYYLAVGSTTPSTSEPYNTGYAYFSNGTLVLHDYHFMATATMVTNGYDIIEAVGGNLTIHLEGVNSLAHPDETSSIAGIYSSYGDITITADTGAQLYINAPRGIYMSDSLNMEGGSITIESSLHSITASETIVISGGDLIANNTIKASNIGISNGSNVQLHLEEKYEPALMASGYIDVCDANTYLDITVENSYADYPIAYWTDTFAYAGMETYGVKSNNSTVTGISTLSEVNSVVRFKVYHSESIAYNKEYKYLNQSEFLNLTVNGKSLSPMSTTFMTASYLRINLTYDNVPTTGESYELIPYFRAYSNSSRLSNASYTRTDNGNGTSTAVANISVSEARTYLFVFCLRAVWSDGHTDIVDGISFIINTNITMTELQLEADEPVIGSTADQLTYDTLDSNYEIVGCTWSYYDDLNGIYREMSADTTFKYAENYICDIELAFNECYSPAEDISDMTAYINGNAATVLSDGYTEQTCVVRWEYTTPKQPVEEIRIIGLASPVAGALPDTAAMISNKNVSFATKDLLGTETNIIWKYTTLTSSTEYDMQAGEVFLAPFRNYYAVMYVKAGSALQFTESTTALIDGKTATFVPLKDEYEGYGLIVYNFGIASSDLVYTADSSSKVNETMTVDIETMANADEALMEAYFNGTVAYQWYVYDPSTDTATAIDGANGVSYTVSAEYIGKKIRADVTYSGLTITGEYCDVQEYRGSVQGTVSNVSNGDVVTVNIYQAGATTPLYTAQYTKALLSLLQYSFSNIPEGTYTLEIVSDKYYTHTQEIWIYSDQISTYDVDMILKLALAGSSLYTIDHDNNYIIVKASSTRGESVDTFISNFAASSADVSVMDEMGAVVTGTAKIKTGYSALVTNAKIYTIVLLGDCDANGRFSANDVNGLRTVLTDKPETNTPWFAQANVDGNTRLSTQDVNKLRAFIAMGIWS